MDCLNAIKKLLKEDLIFVAEEKIFSFEEKLYVKLVDQAAESLEDLLLASEYLSELDQTICQWGGAVPRKYYQRSLFRKISRSIPGSFYGDFQGSGK